jgi:hypothetical protein
MFALIWRACGPPLVRVVAVPLAVALTLVGCGDEGPVVESGCADVIEVEVEEAADGTSTISATVASADTGWDKYADAWEVRTPDGTVLGTRELLHPHVEEQPFTRRLTGVEIPPGTETITVAARDSVEGFCGDAFEVPVP